MSNAWSTEFAAHGQVPVICTTPLKSEAASLPRATVVSEWFGCPLVGRRRRSLERVFDDEGVDCVIVADHPICVYLRTNLETPFSFHPGMAHQRIVQLRKGHPDRLLRAAEIQRGDVVLDGTFGIGTDSFVFAEAVGPTGRVVGVESSWVLARLFGYAKQYECGEYPMVRSLFERIDVVWADHTDYLRQLPDNSVDVVYFDPMFRGPLHNASSNLEGVRSLTNPARLSNVAWSEAQRVSRRGIVLKERPGYGEFERFGLRPDKPRTKVAFAMWRKENDGARL